MFICETNIIFVLICQRLGLVKPWQQKVKLPLPECKLQCDRYIFKTRPSWVRNSPS